jgi:hypothetical protein
VSKSSLCHNVEPIFAPCFPAYLLAGFFELYREADKYWKAGWESNSLKKEKN